MHKNNSIKANKKTILFVFIFTILGILAMQIPLFTLIGSKAKLTVFDMFAPTVGGFIGGLPGMFAVFLMQLANWIAHGFNFSDKAAFIRLFPMMFAALYFARKNLFNLAIPLLCMIIFNLHPIGRSAWYYSLYWLIPIACYFLQDRYLFARSLGSTFTAHAVGSTIWLWTFGLSKAIWIGLIPMVAMERGLFAVGIMVSYLVFNNVLNYLVQKKIIKQDWLVTKKYVLKWSN